MSSWRRLVSRGWGAALDWLPLLLIGVAGVAAGVQFTAAVKDAEIAALKAEHANAQRDAERQARERLQAAQARGDALTTQLAVAHQAAADLEEKLDAQLRRTTAGRPCLAGPALRLLDRAPGIGLHASLPAPAGGAAAADAAEPAADPAPADAYATDTDVGLWARAAAGRYAECVRRLDALIDWHAGP